MNSTPISLDASAPRDRKQPRPWLADGPTPYPHDMPFFYDPADFPVVREIEAQWETIRDELVAAIQEGSNELVPYHDLEKTNKTASWRTAGLMYWTMKSRKNIARFPKTWEIFRKYPNVTSCSLHLLEPNSTIKPHVGDTDAMMRCHMGLIVPAPLPRCGFRCGNQTTSWTEGKVFTVISEIAESQTSGIELKAVIDAAAAKLPAPEDGKRDTRKQRVRRAVLELCEGDSAPYFLEGDSLSIV